MDASILTLFSRAAVVALRDPDLRDPPTASASVWACCSERRATNTHRSGMVNSIAPYWDGNQTWLVMIGVGLFGNCPVVYAVFLGAFYIPILLLLAGIIFRGVAFEYRDRSVRMRPVWDHGFFDRLDGGGVRSGRGDRRVMRGLPVQKRTVRRRLPVLVGAVSRVDGSRSRARLLLARCGVARAQKRRRACVTGHTPESRGSLPACSWCSE